MRPLFGEEVAGALRPDGVRALYSIALPKSYDGPPLAGARIALAADDPLLFGTRLVDQYEIAREVHGFDDTELAGLARGSIDASRAPSDVKARLHAGIDAWLAG